MNIAPDDIVMIGDIAERQGVSRAAVQGWMRKASFPRPVAQLRAGAVYDYGAIVLWRRERLAQARERVEKEEVAQW